MSKENINLNRVRSLSIGYVRTYLFKNLFLIVVKINLYIR